MTTCQPSLLASLSALPFSLPLKSLTKSLSRHGSLTKDNGGSSVESERAKANAEPGPAGGRRRHGPEGAPSLDFSS
jgi:hypothetical protein